MIVTIDGPAGAGKSTVARRLAQVLGFDYLDTGAMYRAVALAGMRRGVDWDQPEQLARLSKEIDIEAAGPKTFLDGEDVSDAVRTAEVTAVTRYAADNFDVRRQLVRIQQEIGRTRDIVTEGRDQGSEVFPDAECKIFLTAGAEERAKRRVLDLQRQGRPQPYEEVLEAINRRDAEDQGRAMGALCVPDGAEEFATDGLSIDQVVEGLAAIVRSSVKRS